MADPYSPDEGFGYPLGKTLKMVSWLLRDWSKKNNEEPMSAIPFDKLVEFFCRIWNPLIDFYPQDISFRTPFNKQYFGLHGPGRALKRSNVEPDSHPLIYSGEIVQLFNSTLRGEFRLFEIEGDPSDPKCTFKSGLTPAQIEFWRSDSIFLKDSERSVFSTLGEALAGLSENQVRMLGTHNDANGTTETLTKIWGKWKDIVHDALNKQVETLKEREPKALGAVIHAREIVGKSQKNRDNYDKAFKEVHRAISGTKIEAVFREVQKPTNLIWDTPIVRNWAEKSRIYFAFSMYLHGAILRAMQIDGTILNNEQNQDVEKAKEGWKLLTGELAPSLLTVWASPEEDPPDTERTRGGNTLPSVDEMAHLVRGGNGLSWLNRLYQGIIRHYEPLSF